MGSIHTHKTPKDPLTIRERLAIKFLMIIVQLLAPWEYSHQFDKIWDEIKSEIAIKETPDE